MLIISQFSFTAPFPPENLRVSSEKYSPEIQIKWSLNDASTQNELELFLCTVNTEECNSTKFKENEGNFIDGYRSTRDFPTGYFYSYIVALSHGSRSSHSNTVTFWVGE